MSCEMTMQRYTVHIDLYRGAKSFCDSLPEPGPTKVVFDLETPQLRRVPVALRLESIDGPEAGTIHYVEPKTYPMGVASFDSRIQAPGRYVASVNFQDGTGWMSIGFPFRVRKPDPMRRLKQAAAEAVPFAAPFALLLGVGGYVMLFRRRPAA